MTNTTTTSPARYMEEIEIRMLGQYVTLTRTSWLDLLDELRSESELARRIRGRLNSA